MASNFIEEYRIAVNMVNAVQTYFNRLYAQLGYGTWIDWESGIYNPDSVKTTLWYDINRGAPLAALAYNGLKILDYEVRRCLNNDLLSTEISIHIAPVRDTAIIGISTSNCSLAWGPYNDS